MYFELFLLYSLYIHFPFFHLVSLPAFLGLFILTIADAIIVVVAIIITIILS